MKVEIDEQEVLDNLSNEEIFDKVDLDAEACKEQLGDKLLTEFTTADIIAYFGEDNILNEIGEEAVIQHFGIDVAE